MQGSYVFYCNRDDANDGFFDKHKQQLLKTNYDIKYTAGRRATEKDGEKTAKKAKEILLYSPRIKTTFQNLFDEVG
jgi:hypothetical protein